MIPASVELEESLRNGVVLAKLAHFISPDKVPLRKVYDKDLSRYNVSKLMSLHLCLHALHIHDADLMENVKNAFRTIWKSWNKLLVSLTHPAKSTWFMSGLSLTQN